MVDQKDWLDALNTLRRNLKERGAILLMDTISKETDRLSRYAGRRSMQEYSGARSEISMRFTDELAQIHNEFYAIRYA